MKLLVAGDTHGQMDHLHKLCKWAQRNGVDTIVQVGDWGYLWPGEEFRVGRATNVLKQYKLQMFFLDGNHDFHPGLEDLYGATHDADRFVPLSENITYLPRGFTWDWDGVRFMSMGGAVSIDKEERTEWVDWWPQESITDADVNRACQKGRVDILLSHDVPQLPIRLQSYLERFKGINIKLDRASRSNRLAMAAIAQSAEPKLILHGHYHHRYNERWANSMICGLDRDGSGNKSYVIIDTERIDEMIEEIS